MGRKLTYSLVINVCNLPLTHEYNVTAGMLYTSFHVVSLSSNAHLWSNLKNHDYSKFSGELADFQPHTPPKKSFRSPGEIHKH